MANEPPPPGHVDWDRHALFLDIDGTLAPIVTHPGDAAIAPATRAVLERLVALTGGAVAVLTGRALGDADRLLGPLDLPAAGSHGLELRGLPGGPVAPEPGRLDPVRRALGAFGDRHGLLVEEKPGAVTLHYRQTPGAAPEARALVEAEAARAGLRALHGKMVSEIVLPGADKGRALDAFMAHPPFAGRLPIMAGDDVTDEDAFAAAQARGGLGIKIGPGRSAAAARLPAIDPFLNWLARVGAPTPTD